MQTLNVGFTSKVSDYLVVHTGPGLVGESRPSKVEGLCTKTLEPTVTTSSLTMEVEAVTHAIQWLASQRDAQITHAIILTDSMNLLQKVESGMGCPDWHTAMHSLRLQRLLWMYCPGHTGVSGNERADRLASTADITSGLQLGRAEVLRGLRLFLNMDKPEHHNMDRLKEECKKEAVDIPPSEVRNGLVCVQPDKLWHYFKGNFGETAERRGGARMGLSERYDAILS